MLSPYRSLFSIPGAARFVASAFLARLGGAMFGVSIIVMVASRRGSYGLAGALSAVGLVGIAVGGPLLARLIDRRGQSAVAIPAGIVSVTALGCLGLACYLGAPTWVLFLANLGNAVMPQVGTMARARWAHLLRDRPEMLHTANSFEQVSEEICFMTGPAIGAALAAMLFPEAGFLLALVVYAIGTGSMLLQRSTEPPVHEVHEHHSGAAFRAPGLLLLACGLALTGAVFGAADVVVIAFTEAHGVKTWGGLTLGMFAGGSAIGGLLYGARPAVGPIAPRLLWFHLAMFALLLPVLVIDSVPVLAAMLLVAGVAIAPTLITSTMLAQRLVPTSQINEGMTVVLTGLLLGVSAGSFLAGFAVEGLGANRAFVVPVGAAALAVVIAAFGRPRVVRAETRARSLFGATS